MRRNDKMLLERLQTKYGSSHLLKILNEDNNVDVRQLKEDLHDVARILQFKCSTPIKLLGLKNELTNLLNALEELRDAVQEKQLNN